MVKPGTVCSAGGESQAGGPAHIQLKERVAEGFAVFLGLITYVRYF